MTSRPSIKLTLIVLLATAAGASFIACGRSNSQPNNSSPSASPSANLIEVSTTPAISRQLPRFFEATGSLAADVQTDVQPQTAGKVVLVGVDMGSAVKKGQMLVRLEAADYKLRVDQAVAQLDNAKAAVKQAEEKIGLRPNQQFVPERVADVSAARANYDLAESNFQRAQKLVESGDISRAEYDQRKSQRDALRQVYESAIAQARQNYAAVLVARTNVTNAQTQVNMAQRTLSYTVVAAPIDGFVLERPVDVGAYVATTTKIATIVRTNPLWIRIDIPEQAVPQIRNGQSVSLTTSSWPDRSFSGHIARVSPNVSATSRTLTVEAEIDNRSGTLKPGQFGTVRILLPQSEAAVLVPQRALRTISGATYVFVIKNGHAEQRLIQSGQTESDLVEIKSGVAADEVVATSNVDQLSDGAAVRQ
ncbi:MAG TPA: efflux RND transporter periplasmic adaptor subunit [Pyrinomonadaceae bacterium]|nr:efflux RND transporter periplasmic adaptor subunit [Pyrinomonadaceae bacterium]